MRYLGGKARIAKNLAEFINGEISRLDIKTYIEPFVGGCNVVPLINCKKRFAGDLADTPTLYTAMQLGYIPPDTVTEAEYNHIKDNYKSYIPLHVFAMYGCSFSGKFGGGYARSGNRNYALNAKNSLTKKMNKCRDVSFFKRAFWEWDVEETLLYCDPPYKGTTSYAGVPPFNHELFYMWVREMSKTNHVYISEYSMPEDFVCIWEQETKTDMHTQNGREKRIEKLFIHKDQQKRRL